MQTSLQWWNRHAVCSLVILAVVVASGSAAIDPFEVSSECETVEVEQEDDEAEGKEQSLCGQDHGLSLFGQLHVTGRQDCDRIESRLAVTVHSCPSRAPPAAFHCVELVCPTWA